VDRGKVILLNGASSSGKSTIAKALQAAIDQPFWCMSIDHFNAAKMLPQERIASGEYPWKDLRQKFFDGFHRCLPALATAGNNLIVEPIIETPKWMSDLLELLAGLDVFFVGVHCPLEVLEERERARGDRRLGEARTDFETTHGFCTYDFELNSTEPLTANIDGVLNAWRGRKSPSAFELSRSAIAVDLG